ncbi:DUF1214 domain-containing protein [Robertkochia aurantiaca]|uniref:DUF1214 domain-containing protein n=1 Tax=Robertkochia aurantiaca TaxID=2873700 RepID=UPI001CCE2963|nr:DUF1214 domain-containing protein [Robertkochia sp. 3YJGBD-33]
MKTLRNLVSICSLLLLLPGYSQTDQQITDQQVEEIVKHSYQYVAMYNVNNKSAIQNGGWNTIAIDTTLKDHTLKLIARPNNDSFYIICALNLQQEAAVIEMPAFDSKYVSLMVTGYDHYVNIPLSTRQNNFKEPEKILLYSERSPDYQKGTKIEGIDHYFEASGDFVTAIFRVMPHMNNPERFKVIMDQIKSVNLLTLSEYQGKEPLPESDIDAPEVGKTDYDIFENNLLEVMQFVFNHTSFDKNNELDQRLLEIYEPLGVIPGKPYDASRMAQIDGKRFRLVAERVAAEEMAKAAQMGSMREMFQPKGKINLEVLLMQSVVGPIGQPAQEAIYPMIGTTDGKPMNAQNDYVIRMKKDELPPAKAFWSLTLYDTANGFFLPNDRKKYSVGENAGMKLNDQGGIEVYISAEQPEGVPDENWLPLNRGDYGIDVILRLYEPDLDKVEHWEAPKAEKITVKTASN